MATEAGSSVGALTLVNGDWHAINWQKVSEEVRRLQARIVQATQAGRWGKVKALQHLLTHSFSGKAMAVRRVTENEGKKTSGVDGITWNTPNKKATALKTLKQRGYTPLPLRRVYIPKQDKSKVRPLGIPAMRDRAMQALYLLALDPIAETTADPNSYGFRRERCCADAIQQCYILLAKKTSASWILEGDIRSCFDRISHDWLLVHVPMDKALLKKWLKAGFMHRQFLYPTEEGTPQGGIVSPVLANLALDGLEQRLREVFPKPKTRSQVNRVYFVRYADDFVITADSKELLEAKVKPVVAQFLGERGLELSSEKTKITPIEAGFDFLGQTVRKYRGKLLITPSKKNQKAFLEKVREVLHRNKQATAGQVIVQLNPLIRGWANYHRHVNSKRTFADIDHAIFTALWRWAARRHPNKGRRWVQEKYFGSLGFRNWVFFGDIRVEGGETKILHLAQASQTALQHHARIKDGANPYDPAWELYFEERLGIKMSHTLRGRRQLSFLWREQKGICPVCHQKITKLTGWHNHHIVWRVHGGEESSENRVLLHPECHRQLHSQRLSVGKPRPVAGVEKA
jgi:RNA-directed DNA polymerase